MINICHPIVNGKPPFDKCHPARYAQNVRSNRKEIAAKEIVAREERDIDNNATTIVQEGEKIRAKMESTTTNDYNQNIIDSTTRSFDQLCSMINDLEKNISNEIPEIDQPQLQPEKDNSKAKCGLSGTTYEDIMSFLGNLDEGCLDETKTNMPELDTSVLREIFSGVQVSPYGDYDREIESGIARTFKEDLATAKLHIEEKDATIALLKDQLKAERKSACEKLDAQRKSNASKLQAQEEKYKGIVKRHQKFVEQLISEKTELTEKCNSLAQRIKEMEIKVQRDLKTVTERHLVELQRAKEHYAASEKIRRERWIEARTLKIKEMTVKGLEPELRNMVEQHEEELQRLKASHMKELQDAELRIVRRSNQQLDQLRLELTASHEKMLTNEKNILWSRYKERLDDQEMQYKAQQEKFVEELQAERAMFQKEQAKRDAERDALLQRRNMQHQEQLDALRQQNLDEKKSLQESLKREWETWLADYKKQQVIKFEKAENKIREESNRERDRQIELAIGRLDKESRDATVALQQRFDNRFRTLKEEYETKLQDAVFNENVYKDQLLQTKNKLQQVEIQLQRAKTDLQEYEINLNKANELIRRLTDERDAAKKFARQEIEVEKRELEEKIASLYREITQNNANRDVSMAQLHSRIKLIITRKMLTIRNLTKELWEVKSKCAHLDKLLDQQRKEYILKTL